VLIHSKDPHQKATNKTKRKQKKRSIASWNLADGSAESLGGIHLWTPFEDLSQQSLELQQVAK
jgi:hypothetical protein